MLMLGILGKFEVAALKGATYFSSKFCRPSSKHKWPAPHVCVSASDELQTKVRAEWGKT